MYSFVIFRCSVFSPGEIPIHWIQKMDAEFSNDNVK